MASEISFVSQGSLSTTAESHLEREKMIKDPIHNCKSLQRTVVAFVFQSLQRMFHPQLASGLC